MEPAMERELQCIVCHDLYDSPVMLSCCHYFCQAHISAKAQGGVVACPTCDQVTRLSPEGLRVEQALQLVADVWREKRKEAKPSEAPGADAPPVCGLCEERLASRRCLQCDGSLCTECEKSVHSKGMFKSHPVVDLFGVDGRPVARSDAYAQQLRCDVHVGEKLNFYCLDCRKLVCSHCLILGDHRGHGQHTIDQACDTGKDTLSAWLEALRTRVGKIDMFSEKLHSVELDVQNNAEEQRNAINRELDHLRELVEAKRRQLLSKGALEEKQKRVQLQAQIDATEKVHKDALRLVSRSSSLLAVESDHAFLGLVLPLIMDMKNCGGQPIDGKPKVSAVFKPFTTEVQTRLLGELELGVSRSMALGQPQPPTPSGSPGISMTGSMNTPQLTAAATTGYSAQFGAPTGMPGVAVSYVHQPPSAQQQQQQQQQQQLQHLQQQQQHHQITRSVSVAVAETCMRSDPSSGPLFH
eukprot:CAMPEP_0203905578 /NCGR_PEP_ID=MMETSP0359-20131031/47250_1 /ASSEMBLY_ACC=CAM_ASM_000338 /TAXON_ID=268821 /ORGANISM="Scrippsiella Hangoei, Strain SHTV-5" /LENGTH=467 /DNA_ID=CAMNT_0050830057 /DNA_START=21 /DNA_END=1422 /DNA_ORIENTATION=+